MPERARGLARHAPTLGWLWLLWVVLWGSLSVPVVLSGLAVACAVTLAFPLPAVRARAAWRPLRFLGLTAHLVADVLLSAAAVGWEAVRHGGRTTAAIVEVPVRADTDLLVTAVAQLTTLTPGTLVLEIDRRGGLLYVHALGVRDRDGADRRRADTLGVDHRVMAALAARPDPEQPAAASAHPPREDR
ncbi:hypothetical protein BJP39_16520 [Streptomyces sp. CC77]|nr:hypothetical protein BJP39_16520 [Streptomyces sp. CC77]